MLLYALQQKSNKQCLLTARRITVLVRGTSVVMINGGENFIKLFVTCPLSVEERSTWLNDWPF